jgi:hypothetical protein
VVGVSAASCECKCLSGPPRAILTGGRCCVVRRLWAWAAAACLSMRGEIMQSTGYPLRKPQSGYGNGNVALIRLVLTQHHQTPPAYPATPFRASIYPMLEYMSRAVRAERAWGEWWCINAP